MRWTEVVQMKRHLERNGMKLQSTPDNPLNACCSTRAKVDVRLSNEGMIVMRFMIII